MTPALKKQNYRKIFPVLIWNSCFGAILTMKIKYTGVHLPQKEATMRFRQALARFLYGRYGADELYNALFLIEIILLFIGGILSILGSNLPVLSVISTILYIVALGLLIWAMFRFFSRNIEKRRQENAAWLKFKSKFTKKRKPTLPPDTPTHIFRACPKCRSVLRLPRQAGKHTVKCPRCGASFGVKVK